MNSLKLRVGSRIALFIAGSLLAVAGAIMTTPGAASAHHAVLVSSVSCNGIVNWTAVAWMPNDGNPVDRENSDIIVYYQHNGAGPKYAVGSGAFNADNDYTFSGQFTYPPGIDVIFVTVEAVGDWGNGQPGGSTWYVLLSEPAPCQEDTTTTAGDTTTTAGDTTTTAGDTTTTTTARNTTTTTTTAGNTTTTARNTTTTAGNTTTTAGNTTTTTTTGATTTSEVASELPTTTLFDSETPTTTTVRSLPPTGSRSGSMQLVALGLLLIGLSLVLTARRRIA